MKSIIKNKQLFTLQAYNFLRQGILLVISIILAKTNVSTENIAGFETAMLLSTAFSFFVIAGISHSLYPLISAKDQKNRNTYYKHSFIVLSAVGFLALLIILVFAPLLSKSYGYFWQLWPALFVLFNSPSFIAEHFLVLENKYKTALVWGLFSFTAQLLVITIPLVFYQDLIAALMGLALLALFRFVGNLWLLQRALFKEKFDFHIIKEIVQLAWPVMGSLLMGSGFLYVNQFVVKQHTDDLGFALFRYGTREFPLFVILTNAFSSIFSAKIASSDNLYVLNHKSSGINRLMHQVFPLAILFMLISPFLFKLFLNETLAPSWVLFNILLLVVPSKLVFPQSILLAVRKTKHLLTASLMESITGIVLGLIGIYFWSLPGMAMAIVAAYFIEKIALLYLCKKEHIHYFHFMHWPLFLGYSFLLILAFVISMLYC